MSKEPWPLAHEIATGNDDNECPSSSAGGAAGKNSSNDEGEFDAAKDGREGNACNKMQHPGGAAVLRRYPKAEVEGGAGGASGAAGKERQGNGDIEIGVKQSSWSIEEEEKG